MSTEAKIIAATAVLGAFISIASFVGSWFVYGYRIDENDRRIAEVAKTIEEFRKDRDRDKEEMQQRVTKLETTYNFIVQQAVRRGWTPPPTWESPVGR